MMEMREEIPPEPDSDGLKVVPEPRSVSFSIGWRNEEVVGSNKFVVGC